MTAAATTKLMTADELLKMPKDGNRYELVRGVLVRMSPSSIRSNTIGFKVGIKAGNFIDEHELGEYGGFEGGFRLASDPDTVRAPDFWFIRKHRIPPEGLPDSFWPGAPDLVIEVLSPTDRSGEIADWLRDYLLSGARLVWILDPRSKATAVFPAGRMPYFVVADGELDGEDVLPGFKLRLRDVIP